MRYLFYFILLITFTFSQTEYIFLDNIQITDFSSDQKFPEVVIHDNMIHLTWVSIYGNTKNIMYSGSQDFGETFSESDEIEVEVTFEITE